MNHDRPLASVCIGENGFYSAKRIEQNGIYFPFEMMDSCSGYTLRRFIEARITPKSRQGIQEDLEEAGIGRYSVPAILIASNGRDCSDPFWIRFETGPQTWKEVWEAIGVYNKK